MKILVVGSGGREHALVSSFRREEAHEVFVWPGNPAWFPAGVSGSAALRAEGTDYEGLTDWAVRTGLDLCVIGPEQPLVEGLADRMRGRGIAVFGPGADGARLEGSKKWSKDLMLRCGIPTAGYASFTDAAEAGKYIASWEEYPVVVKADGLAAGKGVIICGNREEAFAAIGVMMKEKRFGAAAGMVVIEEFLEGEEVSLMAFTDGKSVVPMVPAQDHKNAGEGDTGPNTGGMGAYAPAPVLPREKVDAAVKSVLDPIVAGLRAEGIDYRGVLYAGLMMTKTGPKVLEFNCRFGDPETQVVLSLLKTPLSVVCLACAEGRLGSVRVEWKEEHAACVVLASGGYPGDYAKGKVISGLDKVLSGVEMYHAGTMIREGAIVTAGGRVLNATATGQTLQTALDRVYAAIPSVSFEGMFYRKDIGWKAVRRQG